MTYNFRKSLTVERLKQALHYNPETGVFTRVPGRGGYRRKDGVAGHKNAAGYIIIGIDGVTYHAHRLAWLYAHGSWPDEEIDHINLDKSDNRLSNLRSATRSGNCRNRAARGYHPTRYGKFVVLIRSGERQRYLGTFATEAEARAVYIAATREAFGEFSAHAQPI